MEKEGKYTKVLTVRIDPKLLEDVKKEADNKGIDVSSYIRGCIRTSMYLKEMDLALGLRKGELY
jgi:predicted DNA binding CopG/RHH family protein